ncbi:polyprenyl synthetase family protein [Streptomyces sp. NPDC006463]|uniref:polyprenyl synthetase family protein n=1 Tax=Streptomyces sp. NPDC006463 TaxID=3364746 RepID=UPI0036C919E7
MESKGIRVALTLLSCQAVDGEAEQAVPAAVAVELVHNASLLHDDVIDGDRLRRGIPALWTVFGVPAAILAGDALFFLANQVLLEAGGALAAEGLPRLNRAVQDLIDGEYADVAFQDRPVVPVGEAQAMAQAKTGAGRSLSRFRQRFRSGSDRPLCHVRASVSVPVAAGRGPHGGSRQPRLGAVTGTSSHRDGSAPSAGREAGTQRRRRPEDPGSPDHRS